MHADPIQNESDTAAAAPRVTPADLEAEIASEHYFTAIDGVCGQAWNDPDKQRWDNYVDQARESGYPETLSLLTFCVLVLKNGIKTVGYSACVSAENFDADIGRKIARKNAVEQLWPLLGFRLADKLAAGEATAPA